MLGVFLSFLLLCHNGDDIKTWAYQYANHVEKDYSRALCHQQSKLQHRSTTKVIFTFPANPNNDIPMNLNMKSHTPQGFYVTDTTRRVIFPWYAKAFSNATLDIFMPTYMECSLVFEDNLQPYDSSIEARPPKKTKYL